MFPLERASRSAPTLFPSLEYRMARSAWDYALNLLSARAYTTRNLRRKLVQKEFAANEIESALARLAQSGLLDDRKFAAEYARQKVVGGGASIRRVKQELARKGIEPRAIDDAVAELLAEETIDQDAAIERLALRKLATLSDADDATRRRRVFGFLARKGYELDDIKRVLSRVLQS